MALRPLLSRQRKLATAVVVFVAITGAYALPAAIRWYDARHAPLPAADQPTGDCTLWFVGSSSVHRWTTLARDMAPWDAHNRGIDGALLPQIVRVLGNEPPGPPPAAIIVYAGENDIAAGATGAEALAGFRDLLSASTRRYGRLPVVALMLKPGPTRWHDLPQQTRFNEGLRRLAATRADLTVVDIRPALLVRRRPGPFYVADGIHMNSAGYARWTTLVRRALARAVLPARRGACMGGGVAG